jgi:hypothetical protein
MPDSVQEAMEAAEKILPGEVAPDGQEDPRWQAIMLIEYFVEDEPEAILPFVLKWGVHEQEDLRSAIACLLLENLLKFHFELIFPRVQEAATANRLFADTFLKSWKRGQAKEEANSIRFDALRSKLNSQS